MKHHCFNYTPNISFTNMRLISLAFLEKEYQFHIESVDFKYLASYVSKIVKKDGKKINKIIADELLYAYEELKKTKEFGNILI